VVEINLPRDHEETSSRSTITRYDLIMLASKPQYSAPLGVSNSQNSASAYHANSQRPATATKVQDGVGYSSPTKSEFSEGQDELSAVR
jgi:mitogen-activated protein kinase kinase kinase